MTVSTNSDVKSSTKIVTRQQINQHVITIVGPFIGLALVILLFSIPPQIRSTFLSPDNFLEVASQTAVVAVSALGMTLIIVSGGIDLSVGSVLALTSVIVPLLLNAHEKPVIAVLVAVLAGGLTGIVNGSLISGLRVTPFIVTLGTLGIIRGCASWLAKQQSINANDTWINNIAAARPTHPWFGLPPCIWITLALAAATAILLRRTVLGRYIVAIGSNETTSRLSGLRVDYLKICIYAISGLLVGIGGVLQFGRLGQGDPDVDIGAELDVIAAVVIGGASLSGGEGSVLGSLLGALIMSLLRSGSAQMGWPSYIEQIIIGGVIISAVALDRLRHRQPSKI